MTKSKEIQDYTPDLEDLFIRFLITDRTLLTRCMSITKSEYFESPHAQRAIKFIMSYANDHSMAPSIEIINTKCGTAYEQLDAKDCATHGDWFLGEYEQFCRHRALEIEILKSADLLQEKRYGEVEANIKNAVQIGLVKDLGTDVFDHPEHQIRRMLEKGDMISTGWSDIDRKLYGGTERGTLNIFAGQSGIGKSLFLQNWSLNLVAQGLNVLYITLELSEALINLRLFAMLSGYGTQELVKDPDDTAMRINKFSKEHGGSMQVKYMPPAATTSTDIRAYVKEYEINTGLKVDAVMVDYLDLMIPYDRRITPSDLFVKDKYVSEELRKLATDCDVVLGTASQLNRQSHDEIDYDHSHISGGISKINTADNVIAIFTTMTMKEGGRYQVQLLKTRSSSGTGAKLDLKYNIKTMRITDWDNEETGDHIDTEKVIENLKKKSVLKPPEPRENEINIVERGSNLREMLKKL
jgi:KaiC/GvpD/RAD55 family RecA-like ATPase